MEQVIDCHCHAGQGDGMTGPWNTSAPRRAHARRAAAAGIAHTIVFPPFHTDYARANTELAELVASEPSTLTGFAFVHAARDRRRVARMLDHFITQHGFRGIKVHRGDAPLSRDICDVARELSVPVLYDVMGEVASVALFAAEYPTVDFIIPHLGSFADDWRAQSAFIGFLPRFPNLYTDTSGVRRFDLLVEAVRIGGASRVLFGSDGPWLHPGLELAKVKALGLPRAAEAMVLGGNIRRLLLRRGPWLTAPDETPGAAEWPAHSRPACAQQRRGSPPLPLRS